MKNASKNQGFSLIELIVVVAIMAVLVVILAPALLTYNERSRAERDNSAMDEVVNAVQLALADAQIYDEVVRFSTVDNISCYVDTDSEANYKRIVTKSNPDGVDQYTFDSTSRQLDETPYYAAGNMRGVTLTFAPDKGSNGSTFDFKQGVVNQYVQIKGNHRVGALQGLCGRIDSSVGESLEIKSQTYRNSEYTVFIRLGSTGGNDENMQNSIQTYGQWSGTNLPAEVSYKLVSDRTIGDPGNQIVEIDDSKWNSTNGTKITLKPGDLNGGGSFTPGTETGNKDYYTVEDFEEHEKGVYAYLVNGNTLVLRNSPREDTSDVIKDYGIVNQSWWQKPWQVSDCARIEYVDIETPILITNASRLFYQTGNLKEVRNGNYMCMEQCINMDNMFQQCSKLERIDVSNWDVGNVKSMRWTFRECEKLTELDVSKWDTSNVTNMEWLFVGCYKLENLDVSKWNVSSVTTLNGAFRNCNSLTKLDVSNWNTTNCTNLSQTFYRCSKLKELDVSNWDTGKVTSMGQLFSGCSSVTKLDVSDWNVSKITSYQQVFNECKSLEKLDLEKWDVSNATNLSDTFRYCTSLKELKVSTWDISNVTGLGGTFCYCESLTALDVANWNTSNVTDMNWTFMGSKNLVDIDISNWDASKVEAEKRQHTFINISSAFTSRPYNW